MRTLKGFITIQALVKNQPNIVSPLGELSTWSMTYTKDRTEYVSDQVPGYRLTGIRSVQDSVDVEVDSVLAKQVLDVARSFHQYATSHIRPYDRDHMKALILEEYHSRIYQLQFGPYVDNGYLALPQWVSWQSLESQDSFVKIWFSDTAFAEQFDDYEIVVVPPIDNLDHFFLYPNEVKVELENRSMTKMMEIVQDSRGVNPETYHRLHSFNYVNRTKDVAFVPTHWNVLIYGLQGDNIDAIKDAIVDYALTHSSYSRTQWESIMPDIFKRTEFLILPRWDKISIPNMAVATGMYGSYSSPRETLNYCASTLPWVPVNHLETHVTIFPLTYKGLTINVVDGINNAPGKEFFQVLYPDYLPVAPTSLDFNRMSENTRKFVLLMQEMIKISENMDALGSVPRTMRKITRDGKLYLGCVVDNIHYLVYAKANVA